MAGVALVAYALCPIGSVFRCPRTGDLYTRVGDQSGEPGWIALYVDHRTDADRDPRMLPDATELLATSDLPAGLVLLAPAATPVPRSAPVAPVSEADFDAVMDTLAKPAAAAFGVGVAQ